MSKESQAKALIFPFSAATTPNIAQAQSQATHVLTRTGELMTTMSRSLWEAQTELLQEEAQQGAKALAPLTLGSDPTQMMDAYNQQWRESSERMVVHLRRVNDLVRDYSWQMLDLYADGLRSVKKSSQDAKQPNA